MTGLSRPVILVLLALWAGAMLLSGLALTAEPTGDGFTRGLNRITGFLGWQVAGAVLAMALWFGVRALPKGAALRWLGRAPGWWAIGIVALVVLWIAVGLIGAELGKMRAQQIDRQSPGPVTTVPED